MPTRPPVVEARCNDCDEITMHHTRSEAGLALAVHDAMGCMDLMVADTYGRHRWKPLSWAGCWVSDHLEDLDAQVEIGLD